MCGIVGEWYSLESWFLSNSFDDWGCNIFDMDIFLVVYCYHTLVWVKYSDASCICKWFDSNKVGVEGRNDVALHFAGRKVVGESSILLGVDYSIV